jgi:hypothetical protein
MIYYGVSNRNILLISAISAPVFLYFASIDQPVRGSVLTLLVCCSMSLAIILQELRNNAKFWTLLLLIFLVHLIILLTIPFPKKIYFGIIYAPLAIIDMYLSARAIILFAQ